MPSFRRGKSEEERVHVRAARGAICVPRDQADDVLSATQRLLADMLARNGIAAEDLISVLFTATEDLRSAFPAEAARRMGLGGVPLMCAREIAVDGAMPGVVRVLMHFNSDAGLADIVHVYLDGAESLRDDLG